MFARRKATPSPSVAGDKAAASDPSGDPPRLAIAADVLAALFLLAGTIAVRVGGVTLHAGILRLSIHSAWRPYLWALVILGIRNWLVPQSPSLAWLFRKENVAWLFRGAGDPLPLEERRLFEESVSWPRRIGRLALLVLGFSVLVGALTWPQVRRLDSVSDLGDPLFSIWRIAWVNHQLFHNPLRLFDANIFYPERLTLTYSDPVIVPALMSAPLFWAGLHPVLIYNLLLLSGFVLSGVTIFLLVRALTGRIDAAVLSGVIFALYPYRLEHYSHLELQMTMWMPLALWAMHRTLAHGRLRDGLATGLAFALQSLSSLYYGCFLAVYMVSLGGALWLGRGRPRRPLLMLAAGAALAAVIIAPVAAEYIASQPMMGDRDLSTIEFYSAQGPDYLKAHPTSRVYEDWSHRGHPERQLFPRLTPVVLSAVALWPPLSVARIAYALSLVVAVDGSLGLNGATFTGLHAYVAPFRGLRVPARFSIFAGMTLAILAGYGATRLLERWPRGRVALTGVMLTLVIVEALPRLPLRRVWREPPPIYSSLSSASPAVLAEFPMPRDFLESSFEARYLYLSIFHWQTLVNGNSGFFPPSYKELLKQERDFPSDSAINYLRSRGVQYVTMHGAFTNPDRYRATVAALDARSDMEMVAAAPWEGSESRLYRFRP